MKIVRFSQLLAKSGKPDVHLVLVDPKKDRVLQAAIRGHKVMTLIQNQVRAKADRCEVGF